MGPKGDFSDVTRKSQPFEIPAADFERAVLFYETVMATTLTRSQMGPMRLAMFPGSEDLPVGGAVTYMEGAQPPGPMGAVVYLFAGDDLALALARVPEAGGVVIVPKTMITYLMRWAAEVIFRDEPAVQAVLTDILATPITPGAVPSHVSGPVFRSVQTRCSVDPSS